MLDRQAGYSPALVSIWSDDSIYCDGAANRPLQRLIAAAVRRSLACAATPRAAPAPPRGRVTLGGDRAASLAQLQRVVATCERRGIAAPPVDVFVESRFADRHGWGNRVTRKQRDQWRSAGAA
jgi:hypothetical protein